MGLLKPINTQLEMVKTYKRFQSQGRLKLNLTEHAYIVTAGSAVQVEQSVKVNSLRLVYEIIEHLFIIKHLFIIINIYDLA